MDDVVQLQHPGCSDSELAFLFSCCPLGSTAYLLDKLLKTLALLYEVGDPGAGQGRVRVPLRGGLPCDGPACRGAQGRVGVVLSLERPQMLVERLNVVTESMTCMRSEDRMSVRGRRRKEDNKRTRRYLICQAARLDCRVYFASAATLGESTERRTCSGSPARRAWCRGAHRGNSS